MEPTDNILKPYKWITEAAVFNKNGERIPSEWLENNADVVALLFSAGNTDKDGIVEKFCEIYENVKFVNVPIEVIYVPLDDTEEETVKAYDNQANWFTLKYADPLIPVLKYMYAITCIPHLLVMRPEGTVISSHAILDLEEYGKNAVITWLSKSTTTKKFRRFSKELSMYGEKWNYLNVDPQKSTKDYSYENYNYLGIEYLDVFILITTHVVNFYFSTLYPMSILGRLKLTRVLTAIFLYSVPLYSIIWES